MRFQAILNIQALNGLELPLNLFDGINPDYPSCIGGLSTQNLSFSGKSIKKNRDNNSIVSGTIDFKNRSRPMDIRFRKRIQDNKLVLEVGLP
ncbi:MAG: hypothetical protein AAGA86_00540 [Bacteroidota bacterium]